MILNDGFFHADPHPGNVFYLPGNRIAFIDFGMVGRLSDTRRYEIAVLLHGLVSGDSETVAGILLDWREDDTAADPGRLHREIDSFVDQYKGVPLKRLNLASMLTDVVSILRDNRIALPPDLAVLVKAFISLEGMGRQLDPDFDMASEAAPTSSTCSSPTTLPRRSRDAAGAPWKARSSCSPACPRTSASCCGLRGAASSGSRSRCCRSSTSASVSTAQRAGSPSASSPRP